MCKLIRAPSPADTPSANCAWLTCGKLMRNLAQCVRRHGEHCLVSVIVIGEKDSLSEYKFKSNLHLLPTLEQILSVLTVVKWSS